jgi:hypothetical protein
MEIIKLARRRGIRFGDLEIVDRAQTIAGVNVAKYDARRKAGKPPWDPHARRGVKDSLRVKDEDGNASTRQVDLCGYKGHVSISGLTGLIASEAVTSGDAPDGKQLPSLV